jgi:hypothetical protein
VVAERATALQKCRQGLSDVTLAGRARNGYMPHDMFDRLFLPALALLAAVVIGLALVWPQGLGARSPGRFGSLPVQQTPQMQAAMKREADASNKRINQARQAIIDLQTQSIAPNQ